jgi:phage terminase small subunit
MAGRRAKPAAILKFEKKSHRTRAELRDRERAEIRLGGKKFYAPTYICGDQIAMERWRECVKIFKEFALVSSSDIGHLARYCKMYSEYRDLLDRRKAIASMDNLTGAEEKQIVDAAKKHMSDLAAKKLFEKVEYILSTSGILSIDSAINKKADQLTKMEDRLFLNPQAKIKTQIAKPAAKPVDPLADAGFANL